MQLFRNLKKSKVQWKEAPPSRKEASRRTVGLEQRREGSSQSYMFDDKV